MSPVQEEEEEEEKLLFRRRNVSRPSSVSERLKALQMDITHMAASILLTHPHRNAPNIREREGGGERERERGRVCRLHVNLREVEMEEGTDSYKKREKSESVWEGGGEGQDISEWERWREAEREKER
jgi:hypothetical protein